MKQETIEQAAERYSAYPFSKIGFIEGAKWQQEQDKKMYSDVNKIMSFLDTEYKLGISDKKTIERLKWYFETYFKQFL